MLHFLFSFRGRIGRWQFWAFAIGVTILQLSLLVAASWFDLPPPLVAVLWFPPLVPVFGELVRSGSQAVISLVTAGFVLSCVIWFAWLAVIAKRLHDLDKRFWWAFPFWIGPQAYFLAAPFLQNVIHPAVTIALMVCAAVLSIWGGLLLFLFHGTPGANRFGLDPMGSPVVNPFQGENPA